MNIKKCKILFEDNGLPINYDYNISFFYSQLKCMEYNKINIIRIQDLLLKSNKDLSKLKIMKTKSNSLISIKKLLSKQEWNLITKLVKKDLVEILVFNGKYFFVNLQDKYNSERILKILNYLYLPSTTEQNNKLRKVLKNSFNYDIFTEYIIGYDDKNTINYMTFLFVNNYKLPKKKEKEFLLKSEDINDLISYKKLYLLKYDYLKNKVKSYRKKVEKSLKLSKKVFDDVPNIL